MKFKVGQIVKSKKTQRMIRVTGPGCCEDSFSGEELQGKDGEPAAGTSDGWGASFFEVAEDAQQPLDPITAHILKVRA